MTKDPKALSQHVITKEFEGKFLRCSISYESPTGKAVYAHLMLTNKINRQRLCTELPLTMIVNERRSTLTFRYNIAALRRATGLTKNDMQCVFDLYHQFLIENYELPSAEPAADSAPAESAEPPSPEIQSSKKKNFLSMKKQKEIACSASKMIETLKNAKKNIQAIFQYCQARHQNNQPYKKTLEYHKKFVDIDRQDQLVKQTMGGLRTLRSDYQQKLNSQPSDASLNKTCQALSEKITAAEALSQEIQDLVQLCKSLLEILKPEEKAKQTLNWTRHRIPGCAFKKKRLNNTHPNGAMHKRKQPMKWPMKGHRHSVHRIMGIDFLQPDPLNALRGIEIIPMPLCRCINLKQRAKPLCASS